MPSPPDADKAEMTSGAPFPNARNVTPATDSEIFSFTAKVSKAGDKYPSAVVPSM